MSNEPTLNDVLEKVTDLSTRFDDVLGAIGEFSTRMDRRFEGIETRLDNVETKLSTVESRLTRVEATMVTKDYLDDKLADTKGDLVVMMRKEDQKVTALVELLIAKNVIGREDAKAVLGMQPFPQMTI